jgi:succinyl-CoA synthetase beta subunit
MKIHEYQARELFASQGIPMPPGGLAADPAEAAALAAGLKGPVMVKAQVLAGGRGKAGGVKAAAGPREAETAAREILALRIAGFPVEKVLVSKACAIEAETYLGVTVDRGKRRLVCIASAAGGVEIETLAVEAPEKIRTLALEPGRTPPKPGNFRGLLAPLFPPGSLNEACRVLSRLAALVLDKDCSLAEINPYALTAEGLLALDAKIVFDDSALYRHPEIAEMRNPEEHSPRELEARAAGLSYVALDGDIGCIVNGAGLAMATMDLIGKAGGRPANFLDVGGSSNPQKVLDAFRLLTAGEGVKAILINIFGGITRCDDIARGILLARERINALPPLVIRLIGTNVEQARAILAEAGCPCAEDLNAAVNAAVSAAAAAAKDGA